ncbi:MAG: hypothetical protein HPY53_11875 [Brevinematales bacterium]|nr:hypothetical protein [Brevinematales bacterium]
MNEKEKKICINYLKDWLKDNKYNELYDEILKISDSDIKGIEELILSKIASVFVNRIKSSLKMAFDDIIKASQGNLIMGAFILASCYIDYLAYYYSDLEKIGIRYKIFVKDFIVSQRNEYNEEALYKSLRCKIVHCYSEGGDFIFTDNKQEMHLKHAEEHGNKLIINLDDFIKELERASKEFYTLLSEDIEYLYNAIKRFKKDPLLRI